MLFLECEYFGRSGGLCTKPRQALAGLCADRPGQRGAVDMICRQASEPLLASPVKGRRGVLSLWGVDQKAKYSAWWDWRQINMGGEGRLCPAECWWQVNATGSQCSTPYLHHHPSLPLSPPPSHGLVMLNRRLMRIPLGGSQRIPIGPTLAPTTRFANQLSISLVE